MPKKIGKQQSYGMNGKPMMGKGEHKMPNGRMMKDSDMASMRKKHKKDMPKKMR